MLYSSFKKNQLMKTRTFTIHKISLAIKRKPKVYLFLVIIFTSLFDWANTHITFPSSFICRKPTSRYKEMLLSKDFTLTTFLIILSPSFTYKFDHVLKSNLYYLSLQTWHSPKVYDVWICRFWWCVISKGIASKEIPLLKLFTYCRREIQTS